MSVSKKDVEYVAQLARLTFSEDEKEILAEDLNQILNYVDQLSMIETDQIDIVVNPYYIENVYREDEVEPSMPLKEVLKNVPEIHEGYVVVPKIISGEV
ncbi:MAG: Asp-tRNA(Asn)/Glu-tRNA(Gln) amidotransferase subunit GatC [Clostridiaceae bacterium]